MPIETIGVFWFFTTVKQLGFSGLGFQFVGCCCFSMVQSYICMRETRFCGCLLWCHDNLRFEIFWFGKYDKWPSILWKWLSFITIWKWRSVVVRIGIAILDCKLRMWFTILVFFYDLWFSLQVAISNNGDLRWLYVTMWWLTNMKGARITNSQQRWKKTMVMKWWEVEDD